jgi:hypothetical protein
MRVLLMQTDWYTTRLLLTNSYMLSELHLISPEQQLDDDFTPSLQLFRRLSSVSTPQDKHYKSDFPRLNQWAGWGTQGWLGERETGPLDGRIFVDFNT